MRDYWEENGQVFVTGGKRYGLTATCRTICIGDIQDAVILDNQPMQRPTDTSVTALPNDNIPSAENVTDKCIVCGDKILFKRSDSSFCSNRCRQKHYRDSRKLQLVLIK